MKKIKQYKVSIWFVINSAFLTLMYFGYAVGVEGAYNLMLMLAVVNIIANFFLLSDTVKTRMMEEDNDRSVPMWMAVPFDVIVAFAMAWYGDLWLAGFWILHLLIQEDYFKELKAYKAEKTKEEV